MSISLRSRIRQAFLLGCVSGAALLVLAAGQASAATYPGGGSTFTGSAEGWKVATSECKVAEVLEICTNNGSGYDATNGAPAGSFAAKTQIPLIAVGLLQSTVVAESPAFTAAGTGSGSVSISRKFVPGGLINLTPNYTYTANLLDKTTNTKQKAVTETLEAEAPFTNKTGAVSLIAGHTYVTQIEAVTTASVLALFTETAGYFDNVVVTGPDAPSNPGGNPGANGGNNAGNGASGANGGAGDEGAGSGSGNKAGSHSISNVRLERLVKSSGLAGAARLRGNRLSVRAKCPAKIHATCTLRLQGLLNRHKAATAVRRARVRKGKVKNFALVVKPAARKVVHKRKRLLFKETVRVGKSKATVYRTIRLIRKK